MNDETPTPTPAPAPTPAPTPRNAGATPEAPRHQEPRAGQRLLVGVGTSPTSGQLVRWARRIAVARGMEWVAVHVERSRPHTAAQQQSVDASLSLARELGAEVLVTHGNDIAGALVRVASRQNATQIVVGRRRGSRWVEWLRGGSLADKVARLGVDVDVHVAREEPGGGGGAGAAEAGLRPKSPLWEYGFALAAVAVVSAAGAVLPLHYYQAAGLVYVLGVVALGLRVGRGPVLLAGVVSALAWNFFFIPPAGSLHIDKGEDLMRFVVYVLVAIITGHLTARVRSRAASERQLEERASALFRFTHSLAEARSLDEAAAAGLRQVDGLFGARSLLLLPDGGGVLRAHAAGASLEPGREAGAAARAFHHRREAGRFTKTQPDCAGFYLPLLRGERVLGVLGVVVPGRDSLTLAQRDLIEAFGRQLALIVERDQLLAARERERVLKESEKLHLALLDNVSHELRTPLTVILSALDGMETRAPFVGFVSEARVAARRLSWLVGNLLNQTRLESGALRPRMDWCDARDLADAAVAHARDSLAGRPLEIAVPEDMPPVRADFALTEQALANLLVNAARHTPAGAPVLLSAGIAGAGPEARVFFSVADKGAGFPPEMRGRIFKKFARGDMTRTGGLGLGLSIVHGFVAAQGGAVSVTDNPGGGAVVTISLPHTFLKCDTCLDRDECNGRHLCDEPSQAMAKMAKLANGMQTPLASHFARKTPNV